MNYTIEILSTINLAQVGSEKAKALITEITTWKITKATFIILMAYWGIRATDMMINWLSEKVPIRYQVIFARSSITSKKIPSPLSGSIAMINGAIAGLGDGCGARTVAAEKARSMLEKSAYAALCGNNDRFWDAVLYDTPFKREDFDDIEMPLRLTAFSDAFYPKIDGFVETSGIDRIKREFGAIIVELLSILTKS